MVQGDTNDYRNGVQISLAKHFLMIVKRQGSAILLR
jgi:hypothetical protein